MLSLLVYTQFLLFTILYCGLMVGPLLLGFVFSGFRIRVLRRMVRWSISAFGRLTVYGALFPYARVRYEDCRGSDELKLDAIFVMNHRSGSDPFLVASVATGKPVIQAVKGWPMRLPFFGFFARLAEYIDVSSMSYDEMRERTKQMLERHVNVFVFPEGTRSGSGEMNQFHGTFFRIAKELDCAIVPVAICGNEKIPDRKFRMHTGRILVRRLPAIPQARIREDSAFKLKQYTREILLEETAKMDKELHA